MKIFYYLKHLILETVPRACFLKEKAKLESSYLDEIDYINHRVDYYLKHDDSFRLPEPSKRICDYKRKGYTSYYFDLKEFLHYFPKDFKFEYYFWDETHIEPVPTLFKARPIAGDNKNSVLFKLDKRRHFRFVDDKLSFAEKKDMAHGKIMNIPINKGLLAPSIGTQNPWHTSLFCASHSLSESFHS